jgi:hypothetical protein
VSRSFCPSLLSTTCEYSLLTMKVNPHSPSAPPPSLSLQPPHAHRCRRRAPSPGGRPCCGPLPHAPLRFTSCCLPVARCGLVCTTACLAVTVESRSPNDDGGEDWTGKRKTLSLSVELQEEPPPEPVVGWRLE